MNYIQLRSAGDENMARTIFQQKPAINKRRNSVQKIKRKHLFIIITTFW